MNIDDIFMKSFLEPMDAKEEKKKLTTNDDLLIIEEKRNKLAIIGKFLQKFVDMGVHVEHHDHYNYNTVSRSHASPQVFHFYYKDSTKHYSPGVSIVIDHPAILEIAIPSNPDEGVVAIKIGSHHHEAHLLQHTFNSYETACKALARFILSSTVKIDKDPKKYIKEAHQKKQTHLIKEENEVIDKDPEIHQHSVPYEQPKLKNDNKNPLKKITTFFKEEDDDDN